MKRAVGSDWLAQIIQVLDTLWLHFAVKLIGRRTAIFSTMCSAWIYLAALNLLGKCLKCQPGSGWRTLLVRDQMGVIIASYIECPSDATNSDRGGRLHVVGDVLSAVVVASKFSRDDGKELGQSGQDVFNAGGTPAILPIL